MFFRVDFSVQYGKKTERGKGGEDSESIFSRRKGRFSGSTSVMLCYLVLCAWIFFLCRVESFKFASSPGTSCACSCNTFTMRCEAHVKSRKEVQNSIPYDISARTTGKSDFDSAMVKTRVREGLMNDIMNSFVDKVHSKLKVRLSNHHKNIYAILWYRLASKN